MGIFRINDKLKEETCEDDESERTAGFTNLEMRLYSYNLKNWSLDSRYV